MFDEDFRINKTNIIVLIITIIILVVLIFTSICLINTLNTPVEGLPDLEITKGRTSTLHPTTTTTTTTTTTVKTTTRALKSPYYNVDVNKILSDPLLVDDSLNREEATTVFNTLYNFANSFFNISDDSLLDITTVVNHAKKNEKDMIVINNSKYGEIYNYDKIVEKMFDPSGLYLITKYTYKGEKVITEKDGKYYRLENKLGNSVPVVASTAIKTFTQYRIDGVVRYYMADYKDQGLSSPVYKELNITLLYNNGRWRIRDYNFPGYEEVK